MKSEGHMGSEMVLAGGLEQALTLSTRLAKSGLIPRALHGKPDDVLVVLLRGQELGLGPMQALAGIHVIEGKGVCSADLIVALCAKRRDVCEFFRLVESTDKRATYETKRAGSPEPTRISFTIEEAQRARLTGKDNWQKYPAAMLRARCATALARAVYPDLALGLYDPDEAEDFQRPASVHPIQSQPAPERELNAPPPKQPAKKLTVIDVQPGETEAQAEARAVGGKPSPVAAPRTDSGRVPTFDPEAPKDAKPDEFPMHYMTRTLEARGIDRDNYGPVVKERMGDRKKIKEWTWEDTAAVFAKFPEPPESDAPQGVGQ